MTNLLKQIVQLTTSKYMTNKCAYIDGAQHGQLFLHAALGTLQQRLSNNERDDVAMEAMVMREAVGDVIELAYTDFDAFSDQWELRVYYNAHVETSNIFVFYFSQKNGQRQYHFRFAGL